MKRWLSVLVLSWVLIGVAGVTPVAADSYSFVHDTDGYINIATAADLTAFAAGINDGSLAATPNARLTNNIVLRDTDDWAEWGMNAPVTTTIPEWTPIGNTAKPYTGSFDGCSFTVSGIYINDSSKDFQGLFGYCVQATIENLAVTKSYINGGQDTAGVVGCMDGSITNCTNSGTVKGTYAVGGVAGYGSANITNCHNTGSISGEVNVGGVAGWGVENITNCYNTGSVSGDSATGGVTGCGGMGNITNCYNTGSVSGTTATGGVVGESTVTITHCYYAADSVPSGCYGIGNSASDDLASTAPKTAAEFASGEVAWLLNTVTGFDTAWDYWTQNLGDAAPSFTSNAANVINQKITFDYSSSGVSTVDYGTGGTTLALPIPPSGTLYTYTSDSIIRSQAEMEAYSIIASEVTFTVDQYALTCNNAGIIEIGTKAELTEFAKYVNAGNTNANAVLTDNIVLRDTDDWGDWSDATAPGDIAGNPAWIPIGNTVKPYSGTFDGGGFTVSGIYINNSLKNFQGLFGYCFQATIENLAVTKSYINGGQYTAGVVGSMDGSITNCTNSGTVKGTYYVGGVAGSSSANITNCHNTGSISGDVRVGGVTGWGVANITNCHNTGSISGDANVGGVTGWGGMGNITNCYNTGSVSGNRRTGGVTGCGGMGNITNCYNTGCVSGTSYTGGVTGEMGIGSTISNCYNTGSVSGTTATGGVVGENTGVLSNCYYVAGSVPSDCYGIGDKTSDDLASTAPKTAAEFASGEVAWRLQNTQAEPIWGQQLSGAAAEALPLLKSADPVRCITFFKADGITLYKNVYLNQNSKLTAADLVGYSWKDASQAAFTADTIITTDLSLTPTVAVLPTATAIYGSKLGSIAFSGGSVPLSGWSWSGTAAELEQIPVLGNTVAYQASYTAAEDILGTMTFAIIPTIKSPDGGGGGTPGMSGIIVAPGASTFDPTGQLTVAITGAPAGAVVYYSLDGSSYSTTLPAIAAAGEITVFIKISCPGYQDYTTQTTVTVTKHQAPEIPRVSVPISDGQATGATELGALLPADCGQTQYQLGTVSDPAGLLNEPPTIDQNGLISYRFRSHLTNSEEVAGATAATDNTTDASTTITVLVTMENYADTTITLVLAAVEPIGVCYATHIQDYGWETDWVTAGALSGTVGEAKRLEALKIELTGDIPAEAAIETAVHVQNKGDLGPFAMGSAAGTSGEGLRLERITLNLSNLPGYTLYYNVHVQDKGWLRDENDVTAWFTSGESAGTIGESLRLESIRIKLVKNPL